MIECLMKQLPDLSSVLPSRAKEILVSFFFERLVSADLNIYGDPMYDFAKALHDTHDVKSEWVRLQAHECFIEAHKKYESDHPKEFFVPNDGNIIHRVARRPSLNKTALR